MIIEIFARFRLWICFAFLVSIFLITPSSALAEECKTVKECAQEMVRLANSLQRENAALQKRLQDVEERLKTAKENIAKLAKHPKFEFVNVGRVSSKKLGKYWYCALAKIQSDYRSNVGNTFQWVELNSEGVWYYKSNGHVADAGGAVCIKHWEIEK